MTDKPEFFVTPGVGECLHELLYYLQAVKVGNRVEISGQGGWSDELLIPDTLEDEIAQAFLLPCSFAALTHVRPFRRGSPLPITGQSLITRR